jgi:hypothetical protein
MTAIYEYIKSNLNADIKTAISSAKFQSTEHNLLRNKTATCFG